MDVSFESSFNDVSASESSLVDDENNPNLQAHDEIVDDDESSGLTDDDLFFGEHDDEIHYGDDEVEELKSEQERNDGYDSPTRKAKSEQGPLSPFSPLTRSYSHQRHDSVVSWKSPTDPDFSLIPCRKVSVVVRVYIPSERFQLCLFPLLPESVSSEGENTFMSPTSSTLRAIAGLETSDIIVVNPTAFGKLIPAEVTMDTARLVANVANIETEDWARRYRFDQVLWPNNTVAPEERDLSLQKLALSMANDAVHRQQASVCLGVGATHSHRTENMFGRALVDNNRSLATQVIPHHYGLLGLTIASALEHLPENAVCTLSLLEIFDEDDLKDLLASDSIHAKPSLKLRQLDSKGAVVQNLSDVPLDSVTGLDHLMRKAFRSNAKRTKTASSPITRGHVIATIKVWQNGVQMDLGNLARCTTVVLADLASGEEGDATNSRRMSSFRKAVSGLRGVLRSLIQQENDAKADNAASYRECTLTRILQRPLMDSRTVVMATVSASTECYERTLNTLNYVNRLLIRPGKTARSPFDSSKKRTQSPEPTESSTASSVLLDQYTDNEALLESMLSDPRQRLAKVIRPRYSSLTTPVKLDLQDEDGYQPYNYMEIDPGAINDMHSVEHAESPSRREVASPQRENHDIDVSEQTESEQDEGDFGRAASYDAIMATEQQMNHGDLFEIGELKQDEDQLDKDEQHDRDYDLNGDKRLFVVENQPSVSQKHHERFVESAAIPVVKAKHADLFVHPAEMSELFAKNVKNGVSLSEDSGKLPMPVIPDAEMSEAMTSEVDEWIASFEAEHVENDASPSHAEPVAAPTPAEDRVATSHLNVSLRTNVVAATSEQDDNDSSKLETYAQDLMNAGDDFDRTPFHDRAKHAFTPKADWSELIDDDESALSLTSLQENIGTAPRTRLRPKISELIDGSEEPSSPSNMEGIVSKAETVATKSVAASREKDSKRRKSEPSLQEQSRVATQRRLVGSDLGEVQKASSRSPYSPSRGSLDRTDPLSPSDQCLGEIHVLEDAVEQIKRLHNGLWETSASSLGRLRHSQLLQQLTIEEAVTARKTAEGEVERLRNELEQQRDETIKACSKHKDEIVEMKSRVEKALMDRSDMETIAEEAIAAQDRLEHDIRKMNEALDAQRRATDAVFDEYNEAITSRDALATELESAMNSLQEFRSSHKNCNAVIADLKMTIERLVVESEELRKERDASLAQSLSLSDVLADKDRLKVEVERSHEENLTLCSENERLTSDLRECQARFKDTEAQRDAECDEKQAALLVLQSELSVWQQRCREAEHSRDLAADEYMDERTALLDELSDVNKQLAESKAEATTFDDENEAVIKERDEEIELLTAEMHSLQLEREQDRERLRNTEEAFVRLKGDAKEKLKQLVKEKKAAAMTISRLKEENFAHADSNKHLRIRVDRAEREREALQYRLTGLQERLEVEQLARREGEGRIHHLESVSTKSKREVLAEPVGSSRHWDPQTNQYTEAERALLKEMEAEKANQARREGIAGSESVHDRWRGSQEEQSESPKMQQLRAEFASFRRQLDAKYFESPEKPSTVSWEAYRAEQLKRNKAEDLAAAMAARAKDMLDKSSEEIVRLKIQLSSVADEKETEILRLRSQLHSVRRESLP